MPLIASRRLLVVVLLLAGSVVGGSIRAQGTEDGSARLEAAIQRQLLTRDLAGAAAEYEAILQRPGTNRRVAGQTRWRLAQAQEQLGRLDLARQNYERIVRDHPDQVTLVAAAQKRLDVLLQDEDISGSELSRGMVVDTSRSVFEWAETQPGCCNRFTVFSDLSVFFPNSGETRRLRTSARSAAYPVVSPNRRDVAYMSWGGDISGNREETMRTGYVPRAQAELRVATMDGASDRLVLRAAGVPWLRPFAWSQDAKTLLTLLERTDGVRQVAIVNAEDGSMRVLKSQPWLSAQDMSFSEDGQFIAYQLSTPRTAQQFELVVMPVTPGTERRFSLSLAPQRGGLVSETDLAIHVLNRIGFGPRPGDIERVKAMGLDAYIDRQLHPERIADPVVDAKISAFRSLTMDIPEVLEKAGPTVEIAGRRRATIFERSAFVERAAAASKTAPSGVPRASGDPVVTRGDDRPLDEEVQTARMIRAVHSERQLQEVLVDFWMNHFNVNLGDHQMAAHFEEQAIRKHVFGRFEDMLSAVTHDPRMLFYLDNWRSSAPAEVIDQRLAALRASGSPEENLAVLERMPFLKESKGLNENLGRELLELHTLGVDGGYTQKDVVAVARILSGWTIGSRGLINGREDDGVFLFDPVMHVDGDKVVLGQTFKSGGVEEGEALLKFLARHPATARHIATKLTRRFIADDPPLAVVESASRTFLSTGGDLREVVKTILMSPQFRSSEAVRAKIKKPFELVASAVRATDATFEGLDAYERLLAGNRSLVSQMGEKVYDHEAPDGNPDVAGAWMNSNALLLRLEFANRLATDKVQGVKPNLKTAQTLLTQLGLPRPTPLQIEQTRAMIQNAAAQAAGMAGGGGNMMMASPNAGTGSAPPPIDPAAVTVAAMLGSPQFQKR